MISSRQELIRTYRATLTWLGFCTMMLLTMVLGFAAAPFVIVTLGFLVRAWHA